MNSSHYARTLARDIVIALLAGLMLLGLTALATRTPEGSFDGFPLTYSVPISSCETPNPFNGCGFSYDMRIIGLDYLFWTALAFALIFLLNVVRAKAS
jgi:hypothetical protein